MNVINALFQPAESAPAAARVHRVHRRGAAGGGQVRQQPADQRAGGEALPARAHRQLPGQVHQRHGLQGLGAQGKDSVYLS